MTQHTPGLGRPTEQCGCAYVPESPTIREHFRYCPTHAAASEMVAALRAAYNALRSYQYGNGSPDLAEGTANFCGALLAKIEEKE